MTRLTDCRCEIPRSPLLEKYDQAVAPLHEAERFMSVGGWNLARELFGGGRGWRPGGGRKKRRVICAVVGVLLGLVISAFLFLCVEGWDHILASKGGGKMDLAFDFDGVFHLGSWPSIGIPDMSLMRACRVARHGGHSLILHTCRRDALLDEAVAWLASHRLVFDAVNEQLPHNLRYYGGDTGKPFADVYFDDRAFGWDREAAIEWLCRLPANVDPWAYDTGGGVLRVEGVGPGYEIRDGAGHSIFGVFPEAEGAQVALNRVGRDRAYLRACRVCGCADARACDGGCCWARPGVCSRCHEAV